MSGMRNLRIVHPEFVSPSGNKESHVRGEEAGKDMAAVQALLTKHVSHLTWPPSPLSLSLSLSLSSIIAGGV